jgi:hypothetical protein
MTKLTRLTVAFGTLIVAIVVVIIMGWLRSMPQNLTLRFHPYVGDTPLVLHDRSYENPGGEGTFSIRDFQLFISNIVIDYSSNSLKEQESYHLVRFDGNTSFDQIVIPEIEIQNLKKVSFGIGVDPKANGTIIISGDLDPNSRMAWNWQMGYKFLLLEGMLTVQNEQLPLVYHIGFDESYTVLNFDISNDKLLNNGVIDFKIDLRRLFQKSNALAKNQTSLQSNQEIKYIDMSAMSHVKFAPDDVKMIAQGFHDFISVF